MPANRLHFSRHGLVGASVVALALGTMAQPAFAAPIDARSAPAHADVSVVELDLTGVAWQEFDKLPDVPPMPDELSGGAEQVDGASIALPPAIASSRVLPAALAGAQAGDPTAEPTPTPSDPVPSEAPPGKKALPDVLTRPLPTERFSVLGLSWDNEAHGVVVRFRVRTDGQWSPWDAVGESDIHPDQGSPDDRGVGRSVTDAIVALGADGLQVWADAEQGTVTGLKAVLIDPGTAEGDARIPTEPATASGTIGSAALRANLEQSEATSARTVRIVTGGHAAGPQSAAIATPAASYPAPAIITRAQWGADESLRNCEPGLSTSMVSAAVHHTASTNAYSPADVPGLLRGFYAFHTRPESAGGRGWCDIGYNFLVDRFGRVFEGRAGSIDKTVIGAHTGGFNGRTVGISAIGEYGAVTAPDALLEAISQTIAWKFAQLRIRAGSATVTMVSGGGASKFPAGTVVTFPTIYGHRDAGLTACPGQSLYDRLPWIRARVAQLVDAGVAASPFGEWDRTTVVESLVEVAGWIHDPDTRSPIRLAVEVKGQRTEAVADVPRPDVAASLPTAGPAHGFSLQVPIPFGSSTICLWALNTADGYDTTLGCRYVTGVIDPGWVQQTGVGFDVAFAQIAGGWEMFHIGNGNVIYRKKFQNGVFTDWSPIVGPRAKRIAATTSPDGRVELFHIGMDDAIYHNWEATPGGDISRLEAFPGTFAVALTAARSGNTWELYHAGKEGTIWRLNGIERNWRPFTGTWASELAATTSDDGRVELFHIGRDQQTWHAWQTAPGADFTGPTGPGSWQPYGDRSTAVAAANGINGSFELYTIGTGGSLWRFAPGSSAYGWQRVLGIGSRIAATNNPDTRVEILHIGNAGGIYHAWQKRPGSY